MLAPVIPIARSNRYWLTVGLVGAAAITAVATTSRNPFIFLAFLLLPVLQISGRHGAQVPVTTRSRLVARFVPVVVLVAGALLYDAVGPIALVAVFVASFASIYWLLPWPVIEVSDGPLVVRGLGRAEIPAASITDWKVLVSRNGKHKSIGVGTEAFRGRLPITTGVPGNVKHDSPEWQALVSWFEAEVGPPAP